MGDTKIKDYGEDVFSEKAIRAFLPKPVAAKLLATMREGKPLDPSIADAVANGMKDWAIGKGATHFTHWFQPLTGGTAEKHDAFLEPTGPAQAVQRFSGRNLIGGETDASSFPSGGLRSTFEARGYTAWDPTSPAFIKRHENGATLCIPTAFCSFTGDTLDMKTPLLRSIQAVSRAIERLMAKFGQPKAHVEITLGAEQEYFLIDRRFYMKRPDLLQTGRTVFGAAPAKHQQLEDHYFGAIKPRILKFMSEVETRLWQLGIPAKTRHNEVAPAQFELAPMFEDLNLAVDHNMMIMEVLRQTAERNGLVCLLHEKPFEGVNGSGKHCNWSIAYGGRNLLTPGDNPRENAIFLTVLLAIIRAIEMHADILRMTTAGAGNDHRLGANEAPPAIISVFLGDELNAVLNAIETGAKGTKGAAKTALRVGVDTLPALPKDTTDRNRTSPFAFTGNKFEFRAPGSSQNCAQSQMVLNTIVAESIDAICDRLDGMKGDFNANLQKLLQYEVKAHKRVIFSGDGYSAAWPKEAAKRGLPNLRDTMAALAPLKDPRNVALFEKYGVLSRTEMLSRWEIGMEDYHRRIRIEASIALEIARSMVRPVVADEFSRLATALGQAKSDGLKFGIRGLTALSSKLGAGLDDLHVKCDRLEKALSRSRHEAQIAAMNDLRRTVDRLESLVDDSRWPLPKYREILFVH
ncbi:MAG: glutamine synthetase III [Kiritimatiellae bacterium]|nr:glutamine synthetase III [Kiritimatiellia bacterium]MBQ7234204.1 glutamine synthetase III [Kiritimatiellia bacterium]MBR0242174.1 glutamine synthetase III [Kiritimatiellia bacterium]